MATGGCRNHSNWEPRISGAPRGAKSEPKGGPRHPKRPGWDEVTVFGSQWTCFCPRLPKWTLKWCNLAPKAPKMRSESDAGATKNLALATEPPGIPCHAVRQKCRERFRYIVFFTDCFINLHCKANLKPHPPRAQNPINKTSD